MAVVVMLELVPVVEGPVVVCSLSLFRLIHDVWSFTIEYAHGTPPRVVVTTSVCSVTEVVVKLELELVLVVEGPVAICPLSPVSILHDV